MKGIRVNRWANPTRTEFDQDVHDIVALVYAGKWKDARMKLAETPRVRHKFEIISQHVVPVVMPSKKHYNKTKRETGKGQWIVPDPPEISKIDGHKFAKKDQYFRHEDLLKEWERRHLDKIARREFGKVAADGTKPDYEWYQRDDAAIHFSPRMKTYKNREGYRRMNGYWFMNNGEPTYMTGKMYCFLQHTRTDKGKKYRFRERDRKWFLFVDYCQWHPLCLGMIGPKPRRVGDTAKSLTCLIEEVTRRQGRHVGMQSKDQQSAESNWDKKLKKIWKRWPPFWKPTNAGWTKQNLTFEHGRGAEYEFKKELGSVADYGTSKPLHYDGSELNFYYMDEGGKLAMKGDKANIVAIWDKVRECLVQGKEIRGMAIIASTVEEMDRGGGWAFQKLDLASEIDEKDEGPTPSGLFSVFFPTEEAYEGFIDKYGFPVIHPPSEAKLKELEQQIAKIEEQDPTVSVDTSQLHLGARKAIEYMHSNQNGKSSIARMKRKYPQDKRDCYSYNEMESPFDQIEIVEHRIGELQNRIIKGLDLPWIQGRFEWIDKTNPIKGVEFIPDSRGRFYVDRYRGLPNVDDPSWQPNMVSPSRIADPECLFRPQNKAFGGGIDPYDKRKKDLVSKGFSDGAITIFEKENPNAINYLDPLRGRDHSRTIEDEDIPGLERYNWVSGNIICWYSHRPEPSIFREDCIKCLWFYGCEAVVETQKMGLFDTMCNRGMRLFITPNLPQGGHRIRLRNIRAKGEANVERGEHTVSRHHEEIYAAIASWIETHGHKCNSIPFLKDISKYKEGREGDVDVYMAGGLCLRELSATNITEKPKKRQYRNARQ